MELNISQMAESAIVIGIALMSVIIAIIKYTKTQLSDSSNDDPELHNEINKVVIAIRTHEDETVRMLTKINSSLTSIRDVITRD